MSRRRNFRKPGAGSSSATVELGNQLVAVLVSIPTSAKEIFDSKFWGWWGSFGIHCLALTICSLVYVSFDFQEPEVLINSLMIDEKDTDLTKLVDQEKDIWNINEKVPIALVESKTIIEKINSNDGKRDPLEEMIDRDMEPAPMAVTLDEMDMGEIVEGMEGEFVNTEGDIGAVDRITVEIISRLKEGKVLVAWLMDASGSLRSRREQVIQRFDRVYAELDELAEEHSETLLTGVVAFGEKSKLMTAEPTADRRKIMQAVRDIPPDDSGIENVFSAIKKTAFEYRKFHVKGYQVLLIVLTDESGNDFSILDSTINEVKRTKATVFVMGPVSPFGRNQMNVKWTDEKTKDVLYLPVERGPESLMIENVRVPRWDPKLKNALFSSGFGPYALARLTRESNGIYFMFNDGNIPGPHFEVTDMLEHTPDYVSVAKYHNLINKSPIRKAVLKVAQASSTAGIQPKTKFLAAGIQFDVRDELRSLQKISEFLDRTLVELRTVEQFRDRETSKRWQAHYDLLMGQILANRVRLFNSIPLLNEMYSKPKVCQDGTTNAWELVGLLGTSLAPNNQDPDKKPEASAKAYRKTVEIKDIELARQYLKRVVEEHPGTPWAVVAQQELEFPLAFKWQETFIIPPEGEKLPWDKVPLGKLTEKQKKAKKKFERFLKEKQKKEELKKKLEESLPDGKRKIPKL
ncbi:MAG: VWA domain-containing protein [Planctomycetes bacterium]|nr:VWA domain-containing protein [Planctomycetota bacterium]MCH9727058.1 VWA domain-containing protein [Planctomycetota bacterium]MCH9775001.1 VWA domain-containing protein [Planctomycetota bacterium]